MFRPFAFTFNNTGKTMDVTAPEWNKWRSVVPIFNNIDYYLTVVNKVGRVIDIHDVKGVLAVNSIWCTVFQYNRFWTFNTAMFSLQKNVFLTYNKIVVYLDRGLSIYLIWVIK